MKFTNKLLLLGLFFFWFIFVIFYHVDVISHVTYSLNMEFLHNFLFTSISLIVLLLTIKKILLLKNVSLIDLKKKISNIISDLWIRYFIIRFNPNKIIFYRGLLNIAVIFLVNYLFANEYCNPNLFAQETVQTNVKVELDNPQLVVGDSVDDKVFSVKEAKKVIKRARYLADLTLKDVNFETEKDKLPVFPLYPDNEFDYLDEPLTLSPMPMVPEVDVYEGPAKYGWHDPVDKIGSAFYLFDWERLERHDIDLIVEAMFENEEVPLDQQLEKEFVDEDLYWDRYDTDPPYWYSRRNAFIYDFDSWDSVVVRKLVWDWDWYGTSRASAYYYNLYWAHPFEIEDYDQAECIENVFDRSDLQESFGIGDRPARYEFFLSLLERGFETEPIPQAEKLKKRPIDSYVSSVPFVVSCVFFALFGGSWYMYDQIYNKDYFEEFRQTTPYYQYYTNITYTRRPNPEFTDQLAGVLYGWDRKETVEWRIYYDETYVDTLKRQRITRKKLNKEFEDRIMNYWLGKGLLGTPRYWEYWSRIYRRHPWGAFYKVQSTHLNPHWNYWLEEEPIEYSFNTDHKYAEYKEPYDEHDDLRLAKKISKVFHGELKSLERWFESTMMPEQWVPVRQYFVDINVTKGGELKEEYDEEIEEFLAEQMEELRELRGVGIGLGRSQHEELWEDYNFDDFDWIDLEFMFGMEEMRESL